MVTVISKTRLRQLAEAAAASERAAAAAAKQVEDAEYTLAGTEHKNWELLEERRCLKAQIAELTDRIAELHEELRLAGTGVHQDVAEQLRLLRWAMGGLNPARVSEVQQHLAVMAVQVLVERAEEEAARTGEPVAGMWLALRTLILGTRSKDLTHTVQPSA
ncbi:MULTISPECIES: hypothetical protein [Streptomyces]|uniref:Uncharacterized protein n=1 Tax=Streptomyces harbinensis TaxID=1176198 RepID=A0A1I6WAQ5_9ACTN|nr:MULTISPECIES: hypothetical protein [Streptomyces]SFT23002.1 hypothetical protein SAMN05444716_11620 [Streptomyces harbinensis]